MDTDQFSDVQILARTIAGEAENQGYVGQQAVANVIMNRVALKWQGATDARSVCLHRKQFSCWNDSPDNHNRKRILALNEVDDPVYAQCVDIAKSALTGALDDVTNGADSYEVTGTNAYWIRDLTPCAVIGQHSFYKTVAK